MHITVSEWEGSKQHGGQTDHTNVFPSRTHRNTALALRLHLPEAILQTPPPVGLQGLPGHHEIPSGADPGKEAMICMAGGHIPSTTQTPSSRSSQHPGTALLRVQRAPCAIRVLSYRLGQAWDQQPGAPEHRGLSTNDEKQDTSTDLPRRLLCLCIFGSS